jgi:hypothetical protein
MRRLVLILGLVVLAWLGRRQLRSAAHAQRYMTLLALLQIIAVMGKTSPSAKSLATEKRLNNVVIPALGAVGPIASAGNAAFLATLRSASDPTSAGTLGLSYTGPANSAAVFGYLQTGGPFNGLMSSLIAYTGALGTCVNSIISAGSTAGIWP